MESDILECALAAVSSGITDLFDLVEHCLVHSELGRIVEEEGLWPDDYLTFILDESGRATVTGDFKVVRLDELAEGLVFTHRLSAEEISADAVRMTPNLSSLDIGTRQLSSGVGAIEADFSGEPPRQGRWIGPSGWLSAFAAGDVVAFHRQGNLVTLASAGEIGDGEAESDALRSSFDALVGLDEDVGEEAWIVVERALIAGPQLFRSPVRPISELLDSVGLSAKGEFVGLRDHPWRPAGAVAAERFRAGLVDKYELEECCEEGLDEVLQAWRSHLDGGHPNPRVVNRALGHGRVWEAFGDWLERHAGLGQPLADDFLTRLVESGHRHIPATRLLIARHHEAAGRPLAAEAAIEQAVVDDPDYGPALVNLAWYASDRGDAARVVSLLRRAGADDEHPLLAFHASLGEQVPAVGRNDPCPCGSGRKYKQCHLGRVELSPKERVAWLLTKAGIFATRPERRNRLVGLASSAMWEDFEIADMARMMDDNFIIELALFETGAISEFLEERGELLPEDERVVVAEWEHAELGLWEVTATDRESTVTLRDTRTGESVEVDDRTAASSTRTGDQLLARVLPGWGGHWLSAAVVPILPQHRNSLLEELDGYHDADTLAMWYGALQAPPRLSNREGEPMVICVATLRPKSTWAEMERTLDGSYDRDDEGQGWTEQFPLNEEEQVLRAVLRRHDDLLEVRTNSEERLERVIAVLGDVAEVVSETREPARTVKDLHKVAGESLALPEPMTEVTPEALAEIRHKMERRWLDENIPALGGLTPRQAADDPTRREDLVALLRSFDRMAGDPDLGFRPDVLRKELGLED